MRVREAKRKHLIKKQVKRGSGEHKLEVVARESANKRGLEDVEEGEEQGRE